MHKEFNITGVCIPGKHYMVDISDKLKSILKMVERGDYFVINRPRQYGKTTTLFLLRRELEKDRNYLVLDVSFEGIDEPTYKDQKLFIPVFLELIKKSLGYSNETKLIDLINDEGLIQNFSTLNSLITKLVEKSKRRVVFLIDEVDKASNNRLFLDFLGMLRAKFLDRNQGRDHTFHSVILAGVHDVKTLKLKIRGDEDAKYNSPWNIAVNFKVDMSFSRQEITTMIDEYAADRHVELDISFFSEKLFYYTGGYPFLVSYLCKIIDEEILPGKTEKKWEPIDLEKAIQIALKEENTNFESLITNLENNSELYNFVFSLIIDGAEFNYNPDHSIIRFGMIYGILMNDNGNVRVHNRVYEQRIYNFMSSGLEISAATSSKNLTGKFLDESGNLDIKKIFKKFQEFIKDQYNRKDHNFIERNGRLLFLAFIRPILNGRGFDFKEVQVSEEKRLDVVVTFDNKKYIIELKIWRGEMYHKAGIIQLCEYLNLQNEETGYLLVFDIRKESGLIGKSEILNVEGKQIVVSWV